MVEITVGAETELSPLLDRVERGEEFILVRQGRSVARLTPTHPEVGASKVGKREIDEAIAELKMARERMSLGGLSWKELRDEGRR